MRFNHVLKAQIALLVRLKSNQFYCRKTMELFYGNRLKIHTNGQYVGIYILPVLYANFVIFLS